MLSRLFIIAPFMFAVIAFPSPDSGGNSDCAQWCASNFDHPGGCTSLAAHGKGPCYDCGPQNTVPTDVLCSGQCTDTSSDSSNCGACGNACFSGSCVGGQCLGPTCTPGTDHPGGTCDCDYEISCNLLGNRLSTYPSPTATLEECIVLCDNDQTCHSVTWHASTGECSTCSKFDPNPSPGWIFAKIVSCGNGACVGA